MVEVVVVVVIGDCPYITLSVIMGSGTGERLSQYNMVEEGVYFVINLNGKGVSKR